MLQEKVKKLEKLLTLKDQRLNEYSRTIETLKTSHPKQNQQQQQQHLHQQYLPEQKFQQHQPLQFSHKAPPPEISRQYRGLEPASQSRHINPPASLNTRHLPGQTSHISGDITQLHSDAGYYGYQQPGAQGHPGGQYNRPIGVPAYAQTRQ